MPGSYREIDYRIRPAKSIERKMLVDAFRRLSEFGSLDAYRYVGFGSVYFSDFSLFHRALGFKDMISIEDVHHPTHKERFEFNSPFRCITVKFGLSGAVLPDLPWDARCIVWLDYDGKLNRDVLSDVALVTSKLMSGSMLLVSVNTSSFEGSGGESDDTSGNKMNALEALIESVGIEAIPLDFNNNKSLAGWGMAEASRLIIDNLIAETLKQRNGVLSPMAKMHYKQLFNFHYRDGAKMLTTGGIVFDEGQKRIVSNCAFDQLEFVRSEAESYLIYVPKLTYKEIRALDKLIPLGEDACTVPVPAGDVSKYQKVYRYFPHFAEAEI